jgi:tetratricopeptide (TPR) repeat protein
MRNAWAWPVGLVVAAFALYANALGNPFLSDDLLIIAGNPTLTRPSGAGLVHLWTADYWQGVDQQGRVIELGNDRNLYRPVTIFSFWLDASVGAVEPASFRRTSVLLHAVAAWMVGLWCAAWCGRRAGAVAAAIVLLHPTATDVVNRIVGRADILVVLGVAAFLATQRAAQRTGWTWRRTLGAALAAAVALGAKESGAILVPLALLQAWLGHSPAATTRPGTSSAMARAWRGPAELAARSATGQGTQERAAASRHAWRAILALALPLALYTAGRAVTVTLPRYEPGPWDLMGNPLTGTTLAARLPASATLAWGYAKMLVWPWPLIAFDLPARVPRWSDPTVWVGLAVLGAIIAATSWFALRHHVLALAAAWWLLGFLVVGQLLAPIGTYSDVRLAYSLLGSLAFAAGWLGERAVRRPPGYTLVAAAAAVAIVSTALVVHRNHDFRSDVTLVEADARQRPDNPSTLLRLGGLYERAGRLAEAENALARVTVLAPSSPEGWYELALFHQDHGSKDTARQYYERALALYPAHKPALISLGVIAMEADDLDAAGRFLARAEGVDAGDPFVAYNLAVLDERRGNLERAIARLEDLVKRHPAYTQASTGLAALKQVREEQARRHRSP